MGIVPSISLWGDLIVLRIPTRICHRTVFWHRSSKVNDPRVFEIFGGWNVSQILAMWDPTWKFYKSLGSLGSHNLGESVFGGVPGVPDKNSRMKWWFFSWFWRQRFPLPKLRQNGSSRSGTQIKWWPVPGIYQAGTKPLQAWIYIYILIPSVWHCLIFSWQSRDAENPAAVPVSCLSGIFVILNGNHSLCQQELWCFPKWCLPKRFMQSYGTDLCVKSLPCKL